MIYIIIILMTSFNLEMANQLMLKYHQTKKCHSRITWRKTRVTMVTTILENLAGKVRDIFFKSGKTRRVRETCVSYVVLLILFHFLFDLISYIQCTREWSPCAMVNPLNSLFVKNVNITIHLTSKGLSIPVGEECKYVLRTEM